MASNFGIAVDRNSDGFGLKWRATSTALRKRIKRVSQEHFDIVLLHYDMPGMDEVALACNVKKYSPRTPVVIMTGSGGNPFFPERAPRWMR